MKPLENCTQLFPLAKKEFTENSLLSKVGIMRTSFNTRWNGVPFFLFRGMDMLPASLHTTDDPSAIYTCLNTGYISLQSFLTGVICDDAPLSMTHPFCKSVGDA